jgi:hypothetical protein
MVNKHAAALSVLFVVVISAAQPTAIAVTADSPASLVRLFAEGFGVTDTNGDGLADALDSLIVIPKNATAWHAAAAAEIAARFGFETTALSFPVVSLEPGHERKVLIEVGLMSELEKEIAPFAGAVLKKIVPGSGAIIALPASESLKGHFAVVGGDGPGLHEVAAQFAARWPNAWEIWGSKTSTALEMIERDAGKVLTEAGITDAGIALTALLYTIPPERDKDPDLAAEEKRRALDGMLYDRGEVEAAVLRVELPDFQTASVAVGALKSLLDDHGKGRRVELLDYPGVREVTVEVVSGGKVVDSVTIPRISYPARMLQRRPDPASFSADKEVEGDDFDLAELYSVKGLYADTMKSRLPDGLDTVIVLGPDASAAEIGDFAARLSLECTGVSLPLVMVDPRVDQLTAIKQPVLIGEGAGTDYLRKLGKLHPPELKAGQGWVGIVPDAFNKSNAVVVLGDSEGLTYSLRYLTENYPGISSHLPGDLTLSEVRERAELLLSAKNAAGRFWAACGALTADLPELKRRSMKKLSVEIVIDRSLPGYAATVKDRLSAELPGVEVAVTIPGMRDPQPVIEEEKAFDYEADEFRKLFTDKILPTVKPGERIDLDIRLSEPKQVLDELGNWVKRQLKQKGIDAGGSNIKILCAYKQGFHWLRDEVMPKLRGRGIASILIKFKPDEPNFEEINKFYPERSRWLAELYPIDEILAGELGIPLDLIVFEIDPELQTTYNFTARDSAGGIVFNESFSPATYTRPYLERFPDWAQVTVQTGWVRAEVGGKMVLDRRILTDPERIWDYYQSEILKKAYEHVMKETGEKPTIDKQPFFNTIQVEAWLSEPDERIGVDEEMISAIESLHEDIYFNTLDFFNGMVPRGKEKIPEDARYTTRAGAPGSVIPLIHPGEPGKAPRAKFTFLGNHAKKFGVNLTWTDPEGREDKKSLDIATPDPKELRLSGIVVGKTGPVELTVSAKLGKPEEIAVFSDGIETVNAGSDPVASGLLFDHPALERVRFDLHSGDASRELAMISRHGIAPLPPAVAPAPGERLVRSDEILDPDKAIEIARRLGTYPGVTAYRSGISYQQRPVYTLELTTPTASTHVSRAKLIAAKPTILIVGRQHANEVSSTSHILRLAELLSTDEKFAEYRKRLNIILHPVENPDGAALSMKLAEINPCHMNHAARYTALGVELGTQHDKPDTLLTEALVRPMLWDRWLPDIFLNCHGYPTHEWVQQFAGYSPYQFRDYWIPRGWFVYVTNIDDPRRPDDRRAGRSVLSYIDKFLTSDPTMADLNKRIYERYWRWAGRWQPHVINYELHGRTMIQWERRSDSPRKPSARSDVTVLEETPEQMDETPTGEWMEVVVAQGLSYLEAHLKMLLESDNSIERVEEESGGRVHRLVYRKRPPLMKENN